MQFETLSDPREAALLDLAAAASEGGRERLQSLK